MRLHRQYSVEVYSVGSRPGAGVRWPREALVTRSSPCRRDQSGTCTEQPLPGTRVARRCGRSAALRRQDCVRPPSPENAVGASAVHAGRPPRACDQPVGLHRCGNRGGRARTTGSGSLINWSRGAVSVASETEARSARQRKDVQLDVHTVRKAPKRSSGPENGTDTPHIR